MNYDFVVLIAMLNPIITVIAVYFVIIKRLLNQIDKQTEMINAKTSGEYQQFQIQKMKLEENEDYQNLIYENKQLAERLKEYEAKRFIK